MSDFGDRLAALRQRFLVRAAEDAAAIETDMAAGAWDDVGQRAHRLAGNAGLFGFPDITHDARALEEAIDEDARDEQLIALATTLIAKLRALGPA